MLVEGLGTPYWATSRAIRTAPGSHASGDVGALPWRALVTWGFLPSDQGIREVDDRGGDGGDTEGADRDARAVAGSGRGADPGH